MTLDPSVCAYTCDRYNAGTVTQHIPLQVVTQELY